MALSQAPVLDQRAKRIWDETGQVCLAVGLARCVVCSCPMNIMGDRFGVLQYSCGAHTIDRARLDQAVWTKHLAATESRILSTVTNLVRQRNSIRGAFGAIGVNPDTDPPTIHLYPRLHL